MLRIVSWEDKSGDESFLNKKGDSFIPEEVTATVKKIVQDVRDRGDSAVLEYSRSFDNVKDTGGFRISAGELETAAGKAEDDFIAAINKSIANVKRYHKELADKDFSIMTDNGSVLGSRVTPIDRAAIYVPGGKASYPSTVVMCAVPAIIAGVREIIILTPPSPDGGINPYIAVTAKLLGIDRIFRAGGAQGVAAAAFGTETIPKVDKIVGPGNAYVAAAKREVYGFVDIDMIAGPSEIAVVADSSANAGWVAADMLSQAEHDEMARCFLVTDSRAFADSVNAEIERQLAGMKRKSIISKALENNSAVIVVDDIEKAAEIINRIAPEHLEIITENPFKVLKNIKNAGAIFLGGYSTEPIGDYIAGPNHVLPTYGTAAFFSPLSTRDFQKRSSLIYYSKEDLAVFGPAAITIAEAEGLEAHANALKVRLEYDR
ncbi:MAG: histidinol dehydrogenase [Clostridia bacterium BRH_c25]|nr:MAG: histidinol dehydrogenase [Clostridia bacterium BRH_c25]